MNCRPESDITKGFPSPATRIKCASAGASEGSAPRTEKSCARQKAINKNALDLNFILRPCLKDHKACPSLKKSNCSLAGRSELLLGQRRGPTVPRDPVWSTKR